MDIGSQLHHLWKAKAIRLDGINHKHLPLFLDSCSKKEIKKISQDFITKPKFSIWNHERTRIQYCLHTDLNNFILLIKELLTKDSLNTLAMIPILLSEMASQDKFLIYLREWWNLIKHHQEAYSNLLFPSQYTLRTVFTNLKIKIDHDPDQVMDKLEKKFPHLTELLYHGPNQRYKTPPLSILAGGAVLYGIDHSRKTKDLDLFIFREFNSGLPMDSVGRILDFVSDQNQKKVQIQCDQSTCKISSIDQKINLDINHFPNDKRTYAQLMDQSHPYLHRMKDLPHSPHISKKRIFKHGHNLLTAQYVPEYVTELLSKFDLPHTRCALYHQQWYKTKYSYYHQFPTTDGTKIIDQFFLVGTWDFWLSLMGNQIYYSSPEEMEGISPKRIESCLRKNFTINIANQVIQTPFDERLKTFFQNKPPLIIKNKIADYVFFNNSITLEHQIELDPESFSPPDLIEQWKTKNLPSFRDFHHPSQEMRREREIDKSRS